MPQPALYLVETPAQDVSEPKKRPCRKCRRTDVELPWAHRRDYICAGCNAARMREWERDHPGETLEQKRAVAERFRVAHPEKVLWDSARQRARKEAIPFEIKPEDIFIPPCCPVLGIPLQRRVGRGGGDASPSLDRIVPEKGYVLGNIAVISNKANRIKSNATSEELDRVAMWLRTTLKGG